MTFQFEGKLGKQNRIAHYFFKHAVYKNYFEIVIENHISSNTVLDKYVKRLIIIAKM